MYSGRNSAFVVEIFRGGLIHIWCIVGCGFSVELVEDKNNIKNGSRLYSLENKDCPTENMAGFPYCANLTFCR